MLKKDDLFIIEILERLTVATAYLLTILAGYHDVSVVRKRLKNLIVEGYVDAHYFYNNEKLYFLTGAGLSELEISRKPYEIKGFSTDHFAQVAAAAAWLYIKSDKTSIYDMAFDRDISDSIKHKKFQLSHFPDIIFGHSAIEVELNAKSQERLEENFKENALRFNQQIWIVPERLSRLRERLSEYAVKYNSKTSVYTLEDMYGTIKGFDLKTNNPRKAPLRSFPSPLPVKEKKVILTDKKA